MTLQVAGEQILDLAIVTAKLGANAVTPGKAKLDDVWTFSVLPECTTLPSTDHQFANKEYVDSVASGLDPKASVRAATTAALPACTYSGTPNFTLTANANGALPAQDGQTLTAGQRLLVKNQADTKQQGIYTVTQVGDAGTPWILTRSADMNASAEFPGAFTFVEDGTAQAGTGWVCTAASTFILDGSAAPWAQFSSPGAYTEGNGIDITAMVISGVANTAAGLSVDGSGFKVVLEANHGLGFHAGTGAIEVLCDSTGAMGVGASGIAVKVETDHGLGFHAGTGQLEVLLQANKGLTVGAGGLAGVANAAAAMAVGASGFGVAIEADHGLEFHATTGSLACKVNSAAAMSMGASGLGVAIEADHGLEFHSGTGALAVQLYDTSLAEGSGGIKVQLADTSLVVSSGVKVRLYTGGGVALDGSANGLYVQRIHETKAWTGTGNTMVLSHTPADVPSGDAFLIVTLNGLIQSYDATPEQGEYSISGTTITMGGYTDVPSGYKTEVWYIGWT